MSTKRQHEGKKEEKVSPKKRQRETVFTHVKSTELPNRQMRTRRNNDQMKRIIELVRDVSPAKKQMKDPEYCPEKLKRKQNTKKIVLKPNNELEKIGELNKRKKNIPQQHVEALRRMLNDDTYKGLTIAEVIVMKEQTEELSDEDFMAILTCPSPVWWEDHNEFDEDPIPNSELKKIEETQTIDNVEESTPVEKSATIDNNVAVDNKVPIDNIDKESTETALSMPKLKEGDFGGKFLKKRSVLENILSNIKSKTDGPVKLKSILKPISKEETSVASEKKSVDNDSVANDKNVLDSNEKKSSVEEPCCSKSLNEEAFLCEVKNDNENKTKEVDKKTIFLTDNLGLSKKVLTENLNFESPKEKNIDNSLIIDRYVKILKNRMKKKNMADENIIQNFSSTNTTLCLSGS